jgi:hypothetical protein
MQEKIRKAFLMRPGGFSAVIKLSVIGLLVSVNIFKRQLNIFYN